MPDDRSVACTVTLPVIDAPATVEVWAIHKRPWPGCSPAGTCASGSTVTDSDGAVKPAVGPAVTSNRTWPQDSNLKLDGAIGSDAGAANALGDVGERETRRQQRNLHRVDVIPVTQQMVVTTLAGVAVSAQGAGPDVKKIMLSLRFWPVGAPLTGR